MARIRSLKPELPSSKKLAAASIAARYTFILLITQADDEGFVRAEPRQLLGALYPHDESVTADDLEGWILELARCTSVRLRWTTDGARVIQVLGWEEHQAIKNPGKPKISPTLLPLSDDSPESLGIIPSALPKNCGADVRIFGGSDIRKGEGGGSEVGAADAAAARDPGEDLGSRFALLPHAEAYDAYRRSHRMPDGFDATLLAVHEPLSGGARYSWEVIGAALVEMRGASADFSAVALRAFCRRIVGGDPPPAARPSTPPVASAYAAALGGS